MKKLFTLMALFLSLSSFASLTENQVLNNLKGRYQFKVAGDTINFVIRSSGNILILKSDIDYLEGEMSFSGSQSSFNLNGLPVAHLIFSEGSDEETRDIHLLLTVTENWDGEDAEVTTITSFTTFNDGPNVYSSFEGINKDFILNKYNKKTKKYEILN